MDKTLWIMVGAPACGKSYIAKNVLMKGLGWRYISRDEVRFSIINENDDYFGKENQVYKQFIKNIKIAFDEDGVLNVIADATHLNWASRSKLLNALGQMEKKTWNIIPVVINTPESTVMMNNDERTGRAFVPRSAIRRMRAQTTDPKSDPYKYTGIMYIDNTRFKEEEE